MNEVDEKLKIYEDKLIELKEYLITLENELIHGKRIEEKYFQLNEIHYNIFNNTLIRNEIYIFIIFFLTYFITSNFYGIWYNFLLSSGFNLIVSTFTLIMLKNNNDYKIIKNEYKKYNIKSLILKIEDIKRLINELNNVIYILNNSQENSLKEQKICLNLENKINDKILKKERILK